MYTVSLVILTSNGHRIVSQFCFAQTIQHLHHGFSSIRVRFLPAGESAGAERMAVRLTALKFERLQAR